MLDSNVPVVGVDGCRKGWIAVVRLPGKAPHIEVAGTFEALVQKHTKDAVFVVDMPIGLPEVQEAGGRAAERTARQALKRRRSSVFPIPSRSAVYLEPGEFDSFDLRRAARARASAHALTTSNPPRGITFQAFSIFPKIREIDGLLRDDLTLCERVIESHPELAFQALNANREMVWPKKKAAGAIERKTVLELNGFDRAFLDQVPPRGAAADDFLDACAMMLIAERHYRGETTSFPSPPGRDNHGIPVAIWV